MNLERVEKVAEAVLYEGYMLYPYRPSSIKNRQRWNFGVLCPRSYSEQQHGSERWMMQTECLAQGKPSARLTVKVRFLQLVQRSIGKLRTPGSATSRVQNQQFDLVDRLEVGDRVFEPWQETVEREITSLSLDPAALSSPQTIDFVFPKGRRIEHLCDEKGQAAGVAIRDWETVAGSIEIAGEQRQQSLTKITVRLRNLTSFDAFEGASRDAALRFSLVSAHTILGLEQGAFLSLLDPPEEFAEIAAGCENAGTWPVLVGDEDETMLSSPIILYDHPRIAPESAGGLFDSTEIDEILSLRILTLTDDEKREMRQSDDLAKEILERTENLPEEQFMKLHGALRGLGPLEENPL